MSGPLKSKSFQPLTRIRDSGVLFRPDFRDPGLNGRIQYLYRKAVDPEWTRLASGPERRHGFVMNEPNPTHGLQASVIVAERVACCLILVSAHADLNEMGGGQEF